MSLRKLTAETNVTSLETTLS